MCRGEKSTVLQFSEEQFCFLTLYFCWFWQRWIAPFSPCLDHAQQQLRWSSVWYARHTVTELCFICSIMPEEVTYATLKFPNPSQTKKLQDSSSLKRTGKILCAGSDRREKRLFSCTVGSPVFNSGLLDDSEISVMEY